MAIIYYELFLLKQTKSTFLMTVKGIFYHMRSINLRSKTRTQIRLA